MIVVPTGHEPDRCPHCGRVIEYEGDGFLSALAALGGALMVVIFTIFTLIDWVDPSGGDRTLVQVLAGEWRWLVSMMHRIY